jgi:cardiolipin synthase
LKLNLPNLLTLARLASTPFIVAAITGRRPVLAVAIFCLAAITDALDGMLARRSKAVTRAGAYLDPVADKVFLSAVILALWAAGSVPWWYAAIVFGRDALILLFAAFALLFTTRRQFAPTLWGKASTFFQVAAVVAVLLANVWAGPFVSGFAAATLRISAAATVWSGIHYAVRGRRIPAVVS